MNIDDIYDGFMDLGLFYLRVEKLLDPPDSQIIPLKITFWQELHRLSRKAYKPGGMRRREQEYHPLHLENSVKS